MRTAGPLNRRDAVSWGVAALVGAVSSALLGGCGSNGADTQEQSGSAASPQGAYDWGLMGTDAHGRLAFCPAGAVASRCGIDVSDHNGAVDWAQVAQDGVEFAFLRAGYRGYTEGGVYADERFEENLAGSTAAGLDVGVYFYSSAVDEDEAREEAQFVLDALSGRLAGCRIAFDQEVSEGSQGRADSLTREQYTKNALAFCQTVEAAGHASLVYSNRKHLVKLDLESLGSRQLWYAEYATAHPNTLHDFTVWQYTNTGTVAGIEGAVDMNLWFPSEYLLQG